MPKSSNEGRQWDGDRGWPRSSIPLSSRHRGKSRNNGGPVCKEGLETKGDQDAAGKGNGRIKGRHRWGRRRSERVSLATLVSSLPFQLFLSFPAAGAPVFPVLAPSDTLDTRVKCTIPLRPPLTVCHKYTGRILSHTASKWSHRSSSRVETGEKHL